MYLKDCFDTKFIEINAKSTKQTAENHSTQFAWKASNIILLAIPAATYTGTALKDWLFTLPSRVRPLHTISMLGPFEITGYSGDSDLK